MTNAFGTSITPGDIVCVDIDSTLADTRHRRHLCPTVNPTSTWDDYAGACANDTPITGVIHLVRLLHAAGCVIHIVTNRPAHVREATESWLTERAQVPWNVLWMRLPHHNIAAGTELKVDYALRLQAIEQTVALFIDDWPETAAALEHVGIPVLCPNPRYADTLEPVS